LNKGDYIRAPRKILSKRRKGKPRVLGRVAKEGFAGSATAPKNPERKKRKQGDGVGNGKTKN